MEDQEYTNRFVDVHQKVKIFKDRMRQVSSSDAQLRDDRLVQEAKEREDKEPGSSR